VSRIPRSHKTKRAPLSAARIAAAALALVDEKGLDGLSFRALAAKLRCEAMSLYHYYPSKAHLLDAMADLFLGEIPPVDRSLPWLDRLRALARVYRGAALRHPRFFQFMSLYRMNSRAGLSFLNAILMAFEDSGLDAEQRAQLFRVLGYFVTGAALDEALGYAKGPSAAVPVPEEEARRDFPAIMAVGPFFKPEYHTLTFEAGLDTILRRVAEAAGVPYSFTGTV